VRLATSVPAGADVPVTAIDAGRPVVPGSPARAGERVIDVIATGASAAVARGARVDVLVTREAGDGARGRTTLALEDVEVVAARPAAVDERGGVARVTASLRVTLRQAVYLAAAQSFAREMRLLPRAAGDRRRHRVPVEVDDRL